VSGSSSASVSNRPFCPACRSTRHRLRGRKRGFDLLACRGCGTLYTPVVEQQLASYDDLYEAGSVWMQSSEFVEGRLRELVASFEPFRRTGALLDVGSGAGALLKAATALGWRAQGLEVSSSAVAHLRAQGFEVHHGDVASAAYASDSFDVILASEVFEHVPDTPALIRELHRILRPGGALWGSTPHGAGLSVKLIGTSWCQVEPPSHWHLFSDVGMKQMLAEAGFTEVDLHTQGVNPIELAHHLLRRESRTTQGAPNYESGMQLNESLSRSPSRRALKQVVNRFLDALHLGDSLKIRCIKPAR
jgi:SAM-dependent methyltransferase